VEAIGQRAASFLSGTESKKIALHLLILGCNFIRWNQLPDKLYAPTPIFPVSSFLCLLDRFRIEWAVLWRQQLYTLHKDGRALQQLHLGDRTGFPWLYMGGDPKGVEPL
jgi:hypothetical protein